MFADGVTVSGGLDGGDDGATVPAPITGGELGTTCGEQLDGFSQNSGPLPQFPYNEQHSDMFVQTPFPMTPLPQ